MTTKLPIINKNQEDSLKCHVNESKAKKRRHSNHFDNLSRLEDTVMPYEQSLNIDVSEDYSCSNKSEVSLMDNTESRLTERKPNHYEKAAKAHALDISLEEENGNMFRISQNSIFEI